MTEKTKTVLSLLVVSLFVFSLSACGSSEKRALEDMADAEFQMMEISEQLMNGEITNDEADKMMEKITKNMKSTNDILKETYDNISEFKSLPKWAKSLGIYELKGFDIVASDSSVSEYSKKNYTPESLSLVYNYDDEAGAIKVAEKLAASIGLEESKSSPRLLQKDLENTMKSMMEYMSDEEKAEYESNKMSGYIAEAEKGDYYIMVSVIHGKISILANNQKQMGEFLN